MATTVGTLVQNYIWQETKLEVARNFIPGWLSRAFFDRVRSTCSPHVSTDVHGLLLPRLDSAELVFLSLLIGDMQKQLLYSDSNVSSLSISIDDAKKHLSSFDRDHQERMIRVLECLGQLRFIVNGSGASRDVLKLFTRERWVTDDAGRDLTAVSIQLNEHTLETLTGIIDLHLDLARALNGVQTLRDVTCGSAPLMVWTPVWLELSWPERLLYMRMESIMQSHGCWLRLDGVAGAPISELMKDVEISKKSARDRVPNTGSQLLETLRLFARLGRRLVAHGVLKRAPDAGYLATGGDIESPMLLWQASHERLKSKAETDFVELAGRCVMARASKSQIGFLLDLFSHVSGESSTTRARLEMIWKSIKEIPGVVIGVSSGRVVQGHLLFLEWLARSHSKSVVRLSEDIACSQLSQFLESVTVETAVNKFRGFCDVLTEKRALFEVLGESRLASPITLALEGASQRLFDLSHSTASKDTATCMAVDPATAVAPAMGSVVAASPLTKNTQNLAAIGPNQLASGSQKLQKLACQELEKMIFQSPASYVDLKRRYMETLDLETRSLLLNVQRRLDSRDFERQLRTRLVRFMVDNPASWTSVNTTLPI